MLQELCFYEPMVDTVFSGPFINTFLERLKSNPRLRGNAFPETPMPKVFARLRPPSSTAYSSRDSVS